MSPGELPTGSVAVDAAAAWAAALTLVSAALALLVRLLRAVGSMIRKMEDFEDDWQGSPGRPGVARRPGVMERLDGIETRLEGVERRLGGGPRGGRSSMRAVP